MSPHLDKAKAALEHAAQLDVGNRDRDELIVIANVQANIATVEVLERISDDVHRLADRGLA